VPNHSTWRTHINEYGTGSYCPPEASRTRSMRVIESTSDKNSTGRRIPARSRGAKHELIGLAMKSLRAESWVKEAAH
jgi:hypothetical protein